MESIIIAILGIIAGFFTARATRQDKFVLQDRENWRMYLRKWVKKISDCEINDVTKLQKLRSAIIVRINPHRDVFIMKLLDELIKSTNDYSSASEDKEKQKQAEKVFADTKEKLIYAISVLLKKDWERVKKDSSVFLKFWSVNIVLIIVLIFASPLLLQTFLEDDYLFSAIVLLNIILAYLFAMILTEGNTNIRYYMKENYYAKEFDQNKGDFADYIATLPVFLDIKERNLEKHCWCRVKQRHLFFLCLVVALTLQFIIYGLLS